MITFGHYVQTGMTSFAVAAVSVCRIVLNAIIKLIVAMQATRHFVLRKLNISTIYADVSGIIDAHIY